MENINDLSSSFQDYLLDILKLGDEKKIVRLKDIAEKRKVKMPAVNVMLKKMEKAGLIVHENYGYVELTGKGKEFATQIEKRHKVLYEFLKDILNLPQETAEKDAHKIEHDLDEKAIKNISAFMEFVDLMEKKFHTRECFCFSYFSENGDLPTEDVCKTRLLLRFKDGSKNNKSIER
ncbi:MAG: metal-dependent transcriptional regulator [Thermotogae bacterium]|jgi:DtxR family Mn-dependent transcriptional regulator|nr:metal-dependent transcriptional regulator [Thermotogota bacterium]MCL5031706.1 metal-dependent transcriptional regulator [Thermotogota bacterium]